LWFTFGFIGAAVASEYDFLFWVHVHGAELARGYAPSAAVAEVLVNANYTAILFLAESISRTSGNACWVLAMPASDC
jgi:hypothetical protein